MDTQTNTPLLALYTYRCSGCGHAGEVRLPETTSEVSATCSVCGRVALAEWDAGVELHIEKTNKPDTNGR